MCIAHGITSITLELQENIMLTLSYFVAILPIIIVVLQKCIKEQKELIKYFAIVL